MIRAFLRTTFGFLVAMLAAGVIQVAFAVSPMELARLPETIRADVLTSAGILSLAAATHAAIFSALFALVAIVLAEWRGQREWSYYALVGLMIAMAGFVAQYVTENAAQPTILNNYAFVAFATTGAFAGLIYWMFAGRSAGLWRRNRRDGDGEDEMEPPLAGSKPAKLKTDGDSLSGAELDEAPTKPMTQPTTSVPTTRPAKLQVARTAPLMLRLSGLGRRTSLKGA
ncbi:MAG: hypothetical protein AB7E80_08960 [Hyphomicrobiaceae bacterium]